jgi:hypothetical protein
MRSSGWPTRPNGILRRASARNAGSARMGFVIGVSTKVGAIVFARMPKGASSTASALVNPSMVVLGRQHVDDRRHCRRPLRPVAL